MARVTDGRFPRLSPSGRLVACGASIITINGQVLGPGTTPVWFSESEVLYTRQPDGALMRWRDGYDPLVIRDPGHEPSSLCVDGYGRYAYRDRDRVETSEGRTVPGAFRPTWAGRDLCWCVDTGTTADLYREGLLIARTIHDVRGMPDGRLCYTQQDGPNSWTCLAHPDGRIDTWKLPGAQEYRPAVINVLGDPWVLSHTRDDRLLFRPGSMGVIVATGATFEPDLALQSDGQVRIVWADAHGVLTERILTPPLVVVDLQVDPLPPPPPPPPPSPSLPEPEPSMDMLATLRRLRAAYPATMTDDQDATLMNDAAWEHRNEGYGVSNKDGGTHGHRAGDNEDICHDVLIWKDGTYWDALLGAGPGGPSTPTWGAPSGCITDPSRYWIAPIPPVGGGVVTPPTPPTPPAPKVKARGQFEEEFQRVNEFYRSQDGLKRPGGMVLNGECDILAMIQWGYDLMTGKSADTVMTEIMGSDEYHQKHPR